MILSAYISFITWPGPYWPQDIAKSFDIPLN